MKSNIQKALERRGLNCRSYSGRGMRDKSCLGVVVKGGLSVVGLEGKDQDEFEKCLTDSMGKSTIYYWPGIEFSS